VVLYSLLSLVAPRVARADTDRWLARDKAQHFAATAGIALGGYGGAALLDAETRWRVAIGLGAGMAAGLAKEAWDLSGRGDASWRDVAWDAIGSGVGVLVGFVVEWWLSDRP
jgi:putative lipoprotein